MIKENSFIEHENLVSFIFEAAHLVKRIKNALQNKENKKTKILSMPAIKNTSFLVAFTFIERDFKVMIL